MRQVLCAAAIYALSTPVFAEGQAITYDYSIFVADIEGKVTVGYPTFPDGPMQEVQALLDEITKTALDGF